jgi:sortase A
MKRPCLAIVTAVLMTWGVSQLGQGTWIYAKAELAQHLLGRAWERTLRGEAEVKPWPWADTWPMARLQISKYDVDLILLEGASGRTLAFGPGHVSSSAKPGTPGTAIFSAHRDTHFRFLERLIPGDEMIVEIAKDERHRYRVIRTDIVDARKAAIAASQEAALVLITCYPFATMVPGGPLRYIVTAERL